MTILHCKKCKGRVFYDNMFCDKTCIELYCIMCGKRWTVNKKGNLFAKWLVKK